MRAVLNNSMDDSSRKTEWLPPFLGMLAILLVFVLSLGTYYLHYFPYEDDFSLIRYSAVQNSPAPLTWITQGFTSYFANDPQCATRFFGFDRPVVNATFYLESLLYRSAEGPLMLLTNFLCWGISAWFVYAIARRLGASLWIASSGILLYACSPCWYRILLHASFRNNGISACFVLAATYVLLKPGSVHSGPRLILAGVLVALAAGAHEQGFTSLPVLAVGIAWLSFKAEGKWRTARIVLAVTAVVLPSMLMWICFRLMNPMYGTSYVTSGLSSTLGHSRRLAAYHIHNPFLIATIKLAARLLRTLISSMSALTPLGTENMANLGPQAGWLLFVLTITASIAVVRRYPNQIIPLGALLLYAIGRSFGIPSAEPRFMELEVAWGIIALVCALSAGVTSANRVAVISGAVAAAGLLAFNVVSYNASILVRRPVLLSRNEVDRKAFYRIKAAAATYSAAQVILVNDQEGIESSRDLLILAGFKNNTLEILPSIMNGFSVDGLRDVSACPAATHLQRVPAALEIRLDYPKGCAVTFFGRDMACMAQQYRATGRLHSAAWAAYLQQPENQGLYPSPLIQDLDVEPGKSLLLIVWHNRLELPDLIPVAHSQDLPLHWQTLR